jgi:hypothetical protein
MNGLLIALFAALLVRPSAHSSQPASLPAPPPVTLRSLLDEQADLASLTRLPLPAFTQMQASSYNRASVRRGEPGWFADSDGIGFVRVDESNGRKEWVAMEYEGPGCLTRLWAPNFYRDLSVNDMPVVRIYLDGNPTPVIEERWIPLLTNALRSDRTFVIPSPYAGTTTRAGDVYLPIPFARSCKVTFDREPFYYIVNWRAYEKGTSVVTFAGDEFERAREAALRVGAKIVASMNAPAPTEPLTRLYSGGRYTETLTNGNARGSCLREFSLRLDPRQVAARPEILRRLVLRIECDGELCVWCPLGDFFASPNALNPFTTIARAVTSDGTFTCRWPMPFKERLQVGLEMVGDTSPSAKDDPFLFDLVSRIDRQTWDDRSMHFHASWVPDRILPGDRFEDLRFVEVLGQGVLVGDQLTVLNPTDGWWGEGDEKIYVDGSYERGLPDHFGTGTEDYYGWAGGVNPTWADVFSHPWLANVAVGSHAGPRGSGGSTRGFNICTRQRALDAVPFRERLVLDMEASPGVEQRRPTDRLGYSMVTFWYARPGATSTVQPNPEAAKKALMSMVDVAPPK